MRSRPESPRPNTGNHPSATAKIVIRTIPETYVEIDEPTRVKIETVVSMRPWRLIPAAMPSPSPKIAMRMSA